MALKATLEKIDGLPADLREHYVQGSDGKFLLAVESQDGYSLEQAGELKRALASEREAVRKHKEEVRQAKERLERFGDIEPERAREALAKFEEFAKLDPAKLADEKFAAHKRSLEEAHTKALKAIESDLHETTRQLEETMIVSAAVRAINERGGSVELLLPHVRQISRVRRVDGRWRTEIIGPDGTPRVSMRSGSTDPMSIEELVEEMAQKDIFKVAFRGAGAAGSGAQPGGARVPHPSDGADLEKLDPVARLRELRRRGIVKPTRR